MKLSSEGATCSIAVYPACGIVFCVKIFFMFFSFILWLAALCYSKVNLCFLCQNIYVFTIFNFIPQAGYIFNCGLPRYGIQNFFGKIYYPKCPFSNSSILYILLLKFMQLFNGDKDVKKSYRRIKAENIMAKIL